MTMDPAELRKQLEDRQKPKTKEEVEEAEIIALPATTRIDFDYTAKNKKRYQGEFVFTVPNLGMLITITQTKALMLPNGTGADPIGGFLAEMMCFLEVTLAQQGRPAWWQPHTFYDADVLQEMYRRCKDYERRFRGGADADAGEDAEASPEGSDSSGEDDVVGKVQPPAQRRTPLATQTSRGDRASAGARSAGHPAKRSR